MLTRDVVARAITREVKEGRGSPNGGVFLDIATRRDAEFIRRKLPSMYHQFKELAEIDITEEPMEVGPTLHYFMGGIRVDDETQETRVPGLFASGECAGGMHGANRLGGNSLSDLLVFGKLSGDGAIEYANKMDSFPEVDEGRVQELMREATAPLNREDGSNPYLIQEKLQQMMQRCVGIVRNAEDLQQGLDELGELREEAKTVKAHASAQYNPGWNVALDLRNLIVTAEAVTKAALVREESRGAHTRTDFEGERDEWLQYNVIIASSEDGNLVARKEERSNPPEDLAGIANATLEELEAGNDG